MISKYVRSQTGQAISVIALMIGVSTIGMLGVFAFEMGRLVVARDQLTTATDAAALGGAATLAGGDFTNPVDAHNKAIESAKDIYQGNDIIGVLLDQLLEGDTEVTPSASQTVLRFRFLDPRNNYAEVTVGDPKGKVVEVTATFGYTPLFFQFLGMANSVIPITVGSRGGVPELDLVLCFDLSGSIDDQTPVTFIKRYWDPTGDPIIGTPGSGTIRYEVVAAGSTGLAQGTVYNILDPQPVGTGVNAIGPQNLSTAEVGGTYHQYPIDFDSALRGASDSSKPGNESDTSISTSGAKFTDLVVNLDGQESFASFSDSGYDFPNIDALVEASRGNLEDAAVFASSGASTRLSGLVTPKAGYKDAYRQLARVAIHPLSDALAAGEDFFNIMNTNTDAHFSLVTFNGGVGTDATATETEAAVSGGYPGTVTCALPMVGLPTSTSQSHFSEVMSAIQDTNVVANGATNIGAALNEAVNQLKTKSRKQAKKAIVLFTDGQPTAGTPLSDDPASNARLAAVEAQEEGIPIYTIGLAQHSEIIPGETEILNDTNSDPTTGGIAGIAGNGGKFFLVTDTSQLRLTFENVARHLTQLVR